MKLPVLSTIPAFVAISIGAMADEIEFERINLTRSVSGHCLVPVKVDGHDARFIVDSGAGTVIVLAEALAKSMGKKLELLEGGTALGGGIEMHKTDVGQFKLGTTFPPLKLGGLHVVDLSSASIRVEDADVLPDGLLGAGVMDLCNAVFDPAAPALLIPPRGTPDAAFLESKAAAGHLVLPLLKGGMQMPFIDITLHGKTRTFLVDTGAGPNSLEPDFAAELDLPRDFEGGSLDGAGGSKVENIHQVTGREVLIGDKIEPGATPFFVFSVRAKVQLPEDKTFGGILGVQTLARLGAFVDLGSYSLVIPSRVASDDERPAN